MTVLFSQTSSNCNCSVIESSNGHLLIIDCGIKYKTVDKIIGYRLHRADALLVTHAHKDHTKYLSEFTKSNIVPCIGIRTMEEMCMCPSREEYPHYLMADRRTEFDGFIVANIEMVHTNSDGTPCECFGFLIFDKSTGEKMLWATDTQYIKNKFPPLDYYCIECNYFEQNDYEGELDYINKAVEQRRVQSHMSFESCVKFLKIQDLSKCKEIHLLHLSTKMDDKERKSVVRKMKRALKNEFEGKNIQIFV